MLVEAKTLQDRQALRKEATKVATDATAGCDIAEVKRLILAKF